MGGAAIAVIEVAVNLEADRIEAHSSHRIMNRSHAYWSFGFFGAGITGAGFSQIAISPFLNFLMITVLVKIKVLYGPHGEFSCWCFFLFRQCLLRERVLTGQ